MSVRRGRKVSNSEVKRAVERWEKAQVRGAYSKEYKMRPEWDDIKKGLHAGYDVRRLRTVPKVDDRLTIEP